MGCFNHNLTFIKLDKCISSAVDPYSMGFLNQSKTKIIQNPLFAAYMEVSIIMGVPHLIIIHSTGILHKTKAHRQGMTSQELQGHLDASANGG